MLDKGSFGARVDTHLDQWVLRGCRWLGPLGPWGLGSFCLTLAKVPDCLELREMSKLGDMHRWIDVQSYRQILVGRHEERLRAFADCKSVISIRFTSPGKKKRKSLRMNVRKYKVEILHLVQVPYALFRY